MFFKYFYVHVSVCIYQYPQRQEDGVESPGIKVTGSCEPPHLASGSTWKEVHLTSEPSLKLQIILGYKKTMTEIYLVQQHWKPWSNKSQVLSFHLMYNHSSTLRLVLIAPLIIGWAFCIFLLVRIKFLLISLISDQASKIF